MIRSIASLVLSVAACQAPAGHVVVQKQTSQMRAILAGLELDQDEKNALSEAKNSPSDTWKILMIALNRRGVWTQTELTGLKVECQMWNKLALETDDTNTRDFAILRIQSHQQRIETLSQYLLKLRGMYERLMAVKPQDA